MLLPVSFSLNLCLKHCKKQPKQVTHHANVECPDHCLVRLFKLYDSKCPANRSDDAFDLRPLSRPRGVYGT